LGKSTRITHNINRDFVRWRINDECHSFMLFYFLFYTDSDLRTFTLLFYVVLFLVLYWWWYEDIYFAVLCCFISCFISKVNVLRSPSV
jgi:hypothetical protein